MCHLILYSVCSYSPTVPEGDSFPTFIVVVGVFFLGSPM